MALRRLVGFHGSISRKSCGIKGKDKILHDRQKWSESGRDGRVSEGYIDLVRMLRKLLE